jgi:hypothetical protein
MFVLQSFQMEIDFVSMKYVIASKKITRSLLVLAVLQTKRKKGS